MNKYYNMKKIKLLIVFLAVAISAFSQEKSKYPDLHIATIPEQTLYTGYQYVMNNDAFYAFKYSRAYSETGDDFVTTYTIYESTKGYAYITITATHHKSTKNVEVSVDDANGGIFSNINSEETTYDTPSLQPFGFRGDIGVLG